MPRFDQFLLCWKLGQSLVWRRGYALSASKEHKSRRTQKNIKGIVVDTYIVDGWVLEIVLDY